MADSLIQQIKQKQDFIAKAQKLIASKEDGGITPDEQRDIDETQKQINQTSALLEKLRAQFEADKKEWQGLAGVAKNVADDLKTIQDWGTIDVKALSAAQEAVTVAAKDEDYRSAIDKTNSIANEIKAPKAEYQKQFDAMGKYESEFQDFKIRLEQAKTSEMQTSAVVSGIATLEGNLSSVTKHADAKNYVAANEALVTMVSELNLLETEIIKAQDEDAAVRKLLEPVTAKGAECEKLEFEELKPRIEAATTALGQIGALIDGFDFNGARSEIATLSHEFDLIAAEAEKLAAAKKAEEEKKQKLKEEWERQSGRYEDLKKKVGELETWGAPEAPQLRQIINDIEGYVSSEDYVAATDRLAQGESEVKAPHAEYLKQQEAKKTYDAARPGLNDRAGKARSSKYCDAAVNTALQDLDTDFSWMDGQETSKKYTEANGRIGTATGKLDKIEQLLREAELRAKIAEEMGGTSSEEAERELKKRLYMEEQPPAQERVKKAQDADVLDAKDSGQLEQLVTEMAGAESSFNGQDYAKALESVRMVVGEMPFIEDRVRAQAEKKRLYEAARDKTAERVKKLADSAYKKIREDAGKADATVTEAADLAKAHDYAKAVEKVEALTGEIDRIAKAETDIFQDHAEADAILSEIQGRVDKALAHDLPSPLTLQTDLKTKKDEGEAAYHEEDFKAAVEAFKTARDLLVEVETMVEQAVQKELYDAALVSTRIVERVKEMNDLAYPEAEAEMGAVDGLDKERVDLAAGEKWADARKKTFAEGTALDAFGTQKDHIELARDHVAQNDATLREQVKEAMGPIEETSDELIAAQKALTDIMTALDRAVAEKRFIEAGKKSEEAKLKVEEVLKIRDGLGPVDEAATNNFIGLLAKSCADAVGGAANSAVSDFKGEILKEQTSERGIQTFSKWTGYTMDVVAAVGGFAGPQAPVVGAITTGVKTVVAIVADASDAEQDEEAENLGRQLYQQLEQQAGEVRGCFNLNYASALKAKSVDKYKEVGRFVTKGETAKAGAALQSCGLPVNVSPVEKKNAFLSGLMTRMAAARG